MENLFEYKIVSKEVVDHNNMELTTRAFIYKRRKSIWGTIVSIVDGWDLCAIHNTYSEARAAVGLCRDEDMLEKYAKTTYC